MAQFRIHILGCGSATPSLRHQPACQVIDFRDRLMMIDCGEGAQLAMRRQKLKFSRLRHIFISHLHGDHFLGLPGLLSTMDLSQVGGTVTVHIFEEGARLLQTIMQTVCPSPGFDIQYNIITPERAVIFDTPALQVRSVPLYHRVPAVGFVFSEKPGQRHIIPDQTARYNVPVALYNSIKAGADYTMPDGTIVPNSVLTSDPPAPVSYAYISDTAFDPRIVTNVRGVDVLYHEATYADDNAHKAAMRGHSTAREAGVIARRAGVSTLVLGHFSKAYLSEDTHIAEASQSFKGRVIAADESLTIDVKKR